MKVLIAHSHYRSTAPSGENAVVRQEAQALRVMGHEVVAIDRFSDDIAGWSLPRKAALPATSIRSRNARRELAAQLDRDRPDVVHVHNTFPMLSASVLLACDEAGVPVVATLHNYKLLCASGDFFRDGEPCHACAGGSVLPGLRHGCYRGSRIATAPVAAGMKANRRLWRDLVSAYIFISDSQRRLMKRLDLPEKRVFVKHNLVPPLAGGPAGERRHRVVYLGRLDEAKGIRLLMAAWERFRSRHPDSSLGLAVAGGGPLEDVVRDWSALRPEVEWAGRLDRAQAGAFLGRAVAAVVPSAWEETFGLVAVEAMSLGVAPVAPARGSFTELLRDGVDGMLFAPGDVDDLARVLASADAEPDRFRAFGAQAEAVYLARFHPDRAVHALVDVYRYAVAHPAGRRPERA
jgi:glycosyltransferase involved in cell wall biosynthesis